MKLNVSSMEWSGKIHNLQWMLVNDCIWIFDQMNNVTQ